MVVSMVVGAMPKVKQTVLTAVCRSGPHKGEGYLSMG